MKKIGVEQGMSTVTDYLNAEGYSAEILGGDIQGNVAKCNNLDVIITADYNTNMMDFSDT